MSSGLMLCSSCRFSSSNPTPTEIYTLSLHDALPIFEVSVEERRARNEAGELEVLAAVEGEVLHLLAVHHRSEEHTSELQSRFDLVCRLLLEKKKRSR